MDGGWLPTTVGLPPPIKKHAPARTPTEPRQHSEHGVNLVTGELGSVRLDVKGDGSRQRPKQLRLKFFANNDHDAKLVELRRPIVVFPDTRYVEPALPDVGPVELAEQGKAYLDNHPSMTHIPFELVHSHMVDVVSDATAAQPVYDPYVGNCLASTWARSDSEITHPVGLLVFPMGEVGQELNVSPINYTTRLRHLNDVFVPNAQSAAKFPTAIHQIVCSPFQALTYKAEIQHPTVAIRTVSSTVMMRIKVDHSMRASDRASPAVVEEFTTIPREQTRGRRHMDVALSPGDPGAALIVDDQGAVFEWSTDGHAGANIREHRPPADEGGITLDGPRSRLFHRVSYGGAPNSAYLLSSHSLRSMDLRTRKETLLYSLAGSTSVFTSLDLRLSTPGAYSSPLVSVSTTESISWVDMRMPGRAVVQFEHGRAFDRSLQVLSVESGEVTTTLLTSRLTGLTTAYTLDCSNSLAPTSIHDPYSLGPTPSCSPGEPFSRAGTTLFRHPSLASDRDEVSLYELSSRGGIVLRKLGRDTEDPDNVRERMAGSSRVGRDGYQWQPDVVKLAEEHDQDAESIIIDARDARELRLVDARKQYEDAFKLPKARGLGDQFATADGMERLFTELDGPLEQMVTPHEMAFLSSSEVAPSQRSDFFAASGVITPAPDTLDAIATRLASKKIGKHSLFRHSVSNRIQTLLGRPPNDPDRPPPSFATAQASADQLRSDFDLRLPPQDEEDPPIARRAASHACDVLAFDLALSSDVYSSEPIHATPPNDADELLARATQALSLGRAPELSYAYFRPVIRRQADSLGEGGLEGSTTARMLLSKWVVGEDPLDYKHQDLRQSAAVPIASSGDPMDADDDSGPEDARPASPRSQGRPSQSQPSGRPPLAPLVIASSQPQFHPPSSQRLPPKIATTSEIPPRRAPPPIISIRSPSRSRPSSAEPNLPSSSYDPHAGVSASQPLPSRRTSGGGASSSQPQARAGPSRLAFGSSQSNGMGEDSQGDSQMDDMIPSTQVVPGAFGGKLGGGKKGGGGAGKKPKKRTGGF